MTCSDAAAVLSGDVGEELAGLKSRLNSGIEGKIEPMLNGAKDIIAEQAEDLFDYFQSRPITTLAFTALLAFVIGRLSR